MRSHSPMWAIVRILSAALVAMWFVLGGASGVAAALPDHAATAAHAHAPSPQAPAPAEADVDPTIDAAPESDPTLEATPEPDGAVEASPESDPTLEAAPEPDGTFVEAAPEPDGTFVEPTTTDQTSTEAAPTGRSAGATGPSQTAATSKTVTGTEPGADAPATVGPSGKAGSGEPRVDPAPITTTVAPTSLMADAVVSAAAAPTRTDSVATIGSPANLVASTTASVTPAPTASPSRAVGVVIPTARPTMPLRPLAHGAQPAAADAPLVTLPDGALEAGVVIGMPRMSSAVGLAVEMGRAGHGWAGALVFNLWLRRQMRERRMSQRRLAALSGVNHSTISRLLQNGRTPSLQTASKLAHALRMEWTDEQVATFFDLLDERPVTPMQRVEAALRGDENLSDQDVRALMSVYLQRRTVPSAPDEVAERRLADPQPIRYRLRRTADP